VVSGTVIAEKLSPRFITLFAGSLFLAFAGTTALGVF
jgi:putative Ca2+/H+ antiporter (TMEM165/GDT1 family)